MSQWLLMLLQIATSPEGQKLLKVLIEAILEILQTKDPAQAQMLGSHLADLVQGYQGTAKLYSKG